MFNMKKHAAALEEQTYMGRLESHNKELGLSTDGLKNKETQLEEVRGNKETIDTTEVQLKSAHEGGSDKTIEGQLNSQKTKYTTVERNNDNEGRTVRPIDLLNQAQEAEKLKAYKKAAKGKRDTSFWDDYVEKNIAVSKGVTKRGPSQLQNNADRFTSLSTDPEKAVCNTKVKDMVTASLKDADSMLLDIYFKAAANDRELTKEEQTLVEGISRDKMVLLAQAQNPQVASRIQQLHQLLAEHSSNPNQADDTHTEEMRAELTALMRGSQPHPDHAMVAPFVR